MKKNIINLILIFLISIETLPAYAEVFEIPKFGNISIFYPENDPETFTIFFEGEDDSNKKLRDLLLKANSIVAAISIKKYIENLESGNIACLQLGGDVERLSQVIQNRLKLDRQLPARVAGGTEGALMAIVAAVRAPNTFYQAAVFTKQYTINSNYPLCEDARLKLSFLKENKLITLTSVKPEDLTVIVLRDKNEKDVLTFNYSQMFLEADIEQFDISDNSAARAIQDIYDEDKDNELKVSDQSIRDLPLIEVSLVNNFRDFFIIFFSGDGGWAAIDKDLGASFSEKKIPVIGFNSLKYFWKKKDPKTLAHDLEAVIKYYQKKLKLKKYYLMGYSLGGDVFPAGFNLMPDLVKQDAEGAALLSPSRKVDFEVNLTDWLPVTLDEDGTDVMAEIKKMNMKKILCVYGQDEEDSLCKDTDTNFITLSLPGGHHYDEDYNALALKILRDLKIN